MIIPLTIARVPLKNAFTWYKNAWLLIKAQPLIIMLSSAWALMTLMLLASFPYIGAIASLFLTPVLAFGVADICQKIRINQPVNPLQVFSGLFGKMRNRLFTLGVFYATTALGCLILTQFIDGGRFMQMGLGLVKPADIDPIALAQSFASNPAEFFVKHPTILASIIFQVMTIAITSLFTYAPMFVGWQNANPNQGIALSLISIWRNILPILLVSVLAILTALGFMIVATVIAKILPVIIFGISMFLILLNFTFLYVISYTSYYDILTVSLNASVRATVSATLEQNESNDNGSSKS